MKLSKHLFYANANPPGIRRPEFYRLKAHLLRTYGTCVGEHIQHIKKECWQCTDPWNRWGGDWCERCGNTGIYDEFWVSLSVWEWDDHTFHIPIPESKTRRDPYPGLTPDIEGVIRHAKVDPVQSRISLLTLALIFDVDLFCNLVTGSALVAWHAHPLLIANKLIVGTRMAWRAVKRKLRQWAYNLRRETRNHDPYDLPF